MHRDLNEVPVPSALAAIRAAAGHPEGVPSTLAIALAYAVADDHGDVIDRDTAMEMSVAAVTAATLVLSERCSK